MSVYTTRTMISVVESLPPLHTFIKDTFFRVENPFDTEEVLFDVVKGGMVMASFVHPRKGSKIVERAGFSTKKYSPPLVAPRRELRASEMAKRFPGEPLANGYSPDERKLILLAKDLEELDRSITRREEWMCCMALFTGQIICVGDGVNDVIEFPFENHFVVDAAKTWDKHNVSTPIDDLAMAADAVSQSGYSADIVIAGADTIRHLIRSKDVKELLDNRNYKMGIVAPEIEKSGARYYGYLADPGVHLYAYNAVFADYDNENPDFPGVKPEDKGFVPAVFNLVPEGKVFVGSTSMPGEMLYGCVIDPVIGSFAKPRVPKQWDIEEPAEKNVKISSRPLPCPKNLDAWAILDVL